MFNIAASLSYVPIYSSVSLRAPSLCSGLSSSGMIGIIVGILLDSRAIGRVFDKVPISSSFGKFSTIVIDFEVSFKFTATTGLL